MISLRGMADKGYYYYFFLIRPSPGLLPVLGPLERYMTSTLDAALLISSRASTDLGLTSDVESDA